MPQNSHEPADPVSTPALSGWRRTVARWLLGRDVVRILNAHERAEFRLGESIGPLLEWIRGAEAHLAALQGAYDHRRELNDAEAVELERLAASLALLEGRVADVERAHTDIAVAMAKSPRTVDAPR